MGEPIIVALGVITDAEGHMTYGTAWIAADVPARAYAMLDTTGAHRATMQVTPDLAHQYGGRFISGGALDPARAGDA